MLAEENSRAFNGLRRWLIGLFVAATAGTISYIWLDRPIALYVHDNISRLYIFELLTFIPDTLVPLSGVVFFSLGLWAASGRLLSKTQVTLLICSISLAMAETIKNQLKFAFGRLWPETWVLNNPSLIRDNAYGFNPFHGGPGYASFPSGHLAIACAMISVLWILHPKTRLPCLVVAAAVTIGLLGADYHFLSDIIGGAFVGVTTGWITTSLFSNWATMRRGA